jgi:fatty-acyl-CoA synthase
MRVPLLLDDFLRRPARLYPDKTAIVDGELRINYREFEARVNRLANALVKMKVKKGDRVCMLSPNSHFFLESFYATCRIGAILVPLNYRLSPEEHEYILNHAGVVVALVDHEYTPVVDAIRSKLKTIRHFVVASPDRRPKAAWTDWESLIEKASPDPPKDVKRDEDDVVSINYTSGTTARPKGVMLTHRNCYINAYSLIAHLKVCHDDVELWTLPMFHCNGWGGVYALTGLGGTHVVLRAIDPRRIFTLMQDEGVTFACMAPTVLRAILDYPDKTAHQIKTRPRFVLAGAPPPAAFIERLEKDLGWDFLEIYGLTETAPFLTSSQADFGTRKDDFPRRARAGVEGLGVEIAVLDPRGKPVAQDGKSVGEVCARSNVVFKGYWKQPEETRKAMRRGFFRTGDLAIWDPTYNIHIVDRQKDVIISGGENISSPEIEDVLYRHKSVLECAVIGVPHDKWGETPKAIVVRRPGAAVKEAELLEFCRARLAHFKCPTSVDFVKTLPRTVTGKLQKYRLRATYWKGRERKVAG